MPRGKRPKNKPNLCARRTRKNNLLEMRARDSKQFLNRQIGTFDLDVFFVFFSFLLALCLRWIIRKPIKVQTRWWHWWCWWWCTSADDALLLGDRFTAIRCAEFTKRKRFTSSCLLKYTFVLHHSCSQCNRLYATSLWVAGIASIIYKPYRSPFHPPPFFCDLFQTHTHTTNQARSPLKKGIEFNDKVLRASNEQARIHLTLIHSRASTRVSPAHGLRAGLESDDVRIGEFGTRKIVCVELVSPRAACKILLLDSPHSSTACFYSMLKSTQNRT